MAKRKRKLVEPAFVRELQGYSYTLRALRTEAIRGAPAHMLEGTTSKFRELENNDTEDNEDIEAKGSDAEDNYESTNQPEVDSNLNSKHDTEPAPRPVPKHSFDLPGDRIPAFPDSATASSSSTGPSFISLWPDTFTLKYTPPFTFEEEIEACIRASVESLASTVKIELDGDSDDATFPHPASSPDNPDIDKTDTPNEPPTTSSTSINPTEPPSGDSEFEITPEFLVNLTQQISSTLKQSFAYISKEKYETTYYGSKNFVLPPSLSGRKVLKMLGRGEVIDKQCVRVFALFHFAIGMV